MLQSGFSSESPLPQSALTYHKMLVKLNHEQEHSSLDTFRRNRAWEQNGPRLWCSFFPLPIHFDAFSTKRRLNTFFQQLRSFILFLQGSQTQKFFCQSGYDHCQTVFQRIPCQCQEGISNILLESNLTKWLGIALLAYCLMLWFIVNRIPLSQMIYMKLSKINI